MVSLTQASTWSRIAALALLLINPATSQTTSACNPTEGAQCPADPALGQAKTINLASGVGSDFTASGSPTFGSDGASFTISKSGDSPQINSKWYIMFGHVEYTIKAAPGAGIVSSAVLQSDDLDEIDWEFLGGSPSQVQVNYFSKGKTGNTAQAAVIATSDTESTFHTYAVDWTATQIVWSIDGETVRVLKSADVGTQYPQTPMQVKIGAWAGGDTSANQPGTVQWAGGPTNFAAGPFTMVVKSVAVTDYSTGTSYSYSDSTGTWQSIRSNGGTINSEGNGEVASSTDSASPAITSTSSGGSPWTGTHRSATTLSSAVNTDYPGLPSGWTVSSSGKVIPPTNAGPTPSPTPSSSSQPSSQPASPSASPTPCAGVETVKGFDINGLPTSLVIPAGGPKYDNRGFLITAAPGAACTGTTSAKDFTQVKAKAQPEGGAGVIAQKAVANAAPQEKGKGKVWWLIGPMVVVWGMGV